VKNQTKKKIAEWLMDIAKYMLTAVLISSIFKDFENKWIIYVSCSVSVLLILYIGVNLFDKNSNNP